MKSWISFRRVRQYKLSNTWHRPQLVNVQMWGCVQRLGACVSGSVNPLSLSAVLRVQHRGQRQPQPANCFLCCLVLRRETILSCLEVKVRLSRNKQNWDVWLKGHNDNKPRSPYSLFGLCRCLASNLLKDLQEIGCSLLCPAPCKPAKKLQPKTSIAAKKDSSVLKKRIKRKLTSAIKPCGYSVQKRVLRR